MPARVIRLLVYETDDVEDMTEWMETNRAELDGLFKYSPKRYMVSMGINRDNIGQALSLIHGTIAAASVERMVGDYGQESRTEGSKQKEQDQGQSQEPGSTDPTQGEEGEGKCH